MKLAVLGLATVALRTCAVSVNDTMISTMPFSRLNFPCVSEIKKCDEDNKCLACYDPFNPEFDMSSLDSCEGMQQGFQRSYAADCDTTNQNLTRLELCLADDVFFVLTLGIVKHMCSGHVVVRAEE
jgi:hypothetical protein